MAKITDLFNKPPFRKKRKVRNIGEINTNFLNYITPSMLVTVVAVASIVGANAGQLLVNFNTNPPLNGLIIGLMCYALLGSILGNLILHKTSRFLNNIDNVIAQDDIQPEDVGRLKERLITKGALINTSNMMKAIDNISQFGILNFNDMDARLIKSKLGFRVRLLRGSVGFMSGILVMLGLLGTFWGLLKTIDAVGEAMGAMSNIGDDGEIDIGGFIGSIAAPLQGMGLAFSSSLFGLSGSLLIGFFNNLSSKAQNNFMEDVSRWIDDRIPSFDVKKLAKRGAAHGKILKKQVDGSPVEQPTATAEPVKKEVKANVPNSEILNMLAGVSYLSNKTNQRLGKLFPMLTDVAESAVQATSQNEKIFDKQSEIAQTLHNSNDTLSSISIHEKNVAQQLENNLPNSTAALQNLEKTLPSLTQNMADNIKESTSAQQAVNDTFSTYQDSFTGSMRSLGAYLQNFDSNGAEISNKINTLTGKIETGLGNVATQSATLNNSLTSSQQNVEKIADKHTQETHNVSQQIGQLTKAVDQMNSGQQQLSTEIGKLCQTLSDRHNDEQSSNLVAQLETVITTLGEQPDTQKKAGFSLFKKKNKK